MSKDPQKRILYLTKSIRDDFNVIAPTAIIDIGKLGYCPITNSKAVLIATIGEAYMLAENASIQLKDYKYDAWLVPLISSSLPTREVLFIVPGDNKVYVITIRNVYPFKLTLGRPCNECGTRSRCCYKCNGCGALLEEFLEPIRSNLSANTEIRILDRD